MMNLKFHKNEHEINFKKKIESLFLNQMVLPTGQLPE